MNERTKKIMAISLLGAMVLISVAAMLLRGMLTKENRTAKIYHDGVLIRTIELDRLSEPVEFQVTDDNGHVNTIRAERGRIRILSANCPDKVCVNMGWIENGIMPIVCLPNKVTVEIVGADSDVDIKAGGM